MSENPKSGPGTGSALLPEALTAPVPAAVDLLLISGKDRIEPPKMWLLREFFLLLDEWERQHILEMDRGRRELQKAKEDAEGQT